MPNDTHDNRLDENARQDVAATLMRTFEDLIRLESILIAVRSLAPLARRHPRDAEQPVVATSTAHRRDEVGVALSGVLQILQVLDKSSAGARKSDATVADDVLAHLQVVMDTLGDVLCDLSVPAAGDDVDLIAVASRASAALRHFGDSPATVSRHAVAAITR